MTMRVNGKKNGKPIILPEDSGPNVQIPGALEALKRGERLLALVQQRLKPGGARPDAALSLCETVRDNVLDMASVGSDKLHRACEDLRPIVHRKQASIVARALLKSEDVRAPASLEIGALLYHLDLAGLSLRELVTSTEARARLERLVARYEAEGHLAVARLTVCGKLPNASGGDACHDIVAMYECLSTAGLKLEDIGSGFAEIKRLLRGGKLARARWWFRHAAEPKRHPDGAKSDSFEAVRQMFAALDEAKPKGCLADIPTTDAEVAAILERALRDEDKKPPPDGTTMQ